MYKKLFCIIITSYSIKNYNIDIDTINSYKLKKFMATNIPPLPGILDYFLISTFGSLFSTILKYTIFFILFSNNILASLILYENNSQLSYKLIFITISEKIENIIFKSFFLGLCIVCDISSVYDVLIILMIEIYNYFIRLTNRRTNVYYETFNFCKNLILLTLIPILIYISIFYFDYELRNNTISSSFSLEFNSSFIKTTPTHLKVKHKSFITIINKYHKTYISFDDQKILSTPELNSNCVWQILYNKKNAFRLMHVKTRKFLSINHVNDNDKFFNLELSDWDSIEGTNNELFRTEKTLNARKECFTIKNTNTGLYLGINKFNEVYGSIYSNMKHRYFYIADNHIMNSNEKKFNILYPSKSLLSKIYEHTKFICQRQKRKFDSLHALIIIIIPIIKLFKTVITTRRIYKINIKPYVVFIWLKCLILFFYCNDNSYIRSMKLIIKYIFLKDICRFKFYIYLPMLLSMMVYNKIYYDII